MSDASKRTIRRQLAATRRAKADAEFAQMANDLTYQKEALQVAEYFAEADWEALQAAERALDVLEARLDPVEGLPA